MLKTITEEMVSFPEKHLIPYQKISDKVNGFIIVVDTRFI
jgi:hypothetical protein